MPASTFKGASAAVAEETIAVGMAGATAAAVAAFAAAAMIWRRETVLQLKSFTTDTPHASNLLYPLHTAASESVFIMLQWDLPRNRFPTLRAAVAA
jgi:hypothetical protein